MECVLEAALRVLLLPVEWLFNAAIWRLPVVGRVLVAVCLLGGLAGLLVYNVNQGP